MTGPTLSIPPTLLGLVGAAGAGKDATAAVLQRAGWRAMAFADNLRVEVAEAWGVDIGLLLARHGKEVKTPHLKAGLCMHANYLRWAAYTGDSLYDDRSPRWALQSWGTYRRAVEPFYWVRQVEAWIRYQRSCGHHRIVITDVRMVNEAGMLRQYGAKLVRVHRPNMAPMAADTALHDSEQHTLLRVDADLHNDGDLGHLQAEVARVLDLLSVQASPDGVLE